MTGKQGPTVSPVSDKQFFRFGQRDAALKRAFVRFSRQNQCVAMSRLIKMAMATGLRSMGHYGKRDS